MALPQTRRPPAVEEERRIESSKVERIDVKKLFIENFLDAMTNWYLHMSKRLKARLTPRRLKKQAVSILYTYKYAYNRLPKDWVLKLEEAINMELFDQYLDRSKNCTDISQLGPGPPTMKLYERKKTPKDFSFLEERGIVQVVVDPLAMMRPGESFQSVRGAQFVIGNGSRFYPGPSEKKETDKFKLKPIIDLTRDPPPTDWIQAYHKGEHRRRELTVVPGEEDIVIFYDYNPRYKEPDPEVAGGNVIGSQPVHDADSFTWFSEYLTPEDDWEECDDSEAYE